jgi:Glutathione S-transferase, N-terminal domain
MAELSARHVRKRDAGICLSPCRTGTRRPLYQPVRSIMPEALKLYHAAASPNSRRVRMFLAEKGISLPLVAIDLAAGEQRGEAYRAINPRRVVPTLMVEDGTAIGEVLAIWRYLEDAHPATPLLGTTPKTRRW